LKKAPLLITAGIVLLIVGGFFVYEKFFITRLLNPWDIVPSDAVLVYEKDKCETCVDALSKSQIFRIAQEGLFYQKSISDTVKSTLRQALLRSPGLLISVHPTKKDDFDFVLYFPNSLPDVFSSLGFRI
jgi:hypothetical protein